MKKEGIILIGGNYATFFVILLYNINMDIAGVAWSLNILFPLVIGQSNNQYVDYVLIRRKFLVENVDLFVLSFQRRLFYTHSLPSTFFFLLFLLLILSILSIPSIFISINHWFCLSICHLLIFFFVIQSPFYRFKVRFSNYF